ncbi:FAD-dependent oxidoreductase [Leucobacter sp. USHLN153]|uniref:FAD-dependent oxidoreductase n=1 Tax=Leucobacter sp. USHLN153 TaxID=3081268 RepID=UPI0030180C64
MTRSMTTHTDAIVVGAGPVGMTAALALAARGLRVTIVEREHATSNAPKAISLDDESLRLFQAIGIADEVLHIIVPGTGTAYYGADDEWLFAARAATPYRLGFPFKNPFAQPDLERVLLEAMQRSPQIDVRFGAEVTGIAQDPESITATVSDASGRTLLTGKYLIGADGGRSTVRRELGVRMIGESFDDVWLVADTTGDRRRERYGMHHGNPDRPHVIVPGLEGRCRYEFRISAEEAASFTGEPPFELIRELVAPYRDIEPSEVERAVAYTFHALSAERWRVGRAFLAGDAAHMMPPFAGQGLNSGMRDVANLAWKIARACGAGAGAEAGRIGAGRAGFGGGSGEHDTLLDSYEIERRPHAEAVIRSSVKLGRVVMTTNRRLAEFRDRVVREALETPDGCAFFEEMRYRPQNRLDAGLVEPRVAGAAGLGRSGAEGGADPAPAGAAAVSQDSDAVAAAVGAQIAQPQAFDFDRHEVVPLDELLGNGWAAIAVGVRPADVAAAARALTGFVDTFVAVPLDDLIDDYSGSARTAIDVDGKLYDEFSPHRGRFLLVRPDRFAAISWAPGEEPRVATLLSDWLSSPSIDTEASGAGAEENTPSRKESLWTAPIA